MANLVFTKVGNVYEATATVNADFNLHVEKAEDGELRVMQTHVSGSAYAQTAGGVFSRFERVVDYDFAALVYPVYIKVVSEVNPTIGVITEDA